MRVMVTIMVVTGQGQRGDSVSVSSEQTSETHMKKNMQPLTDRHFVQKKKLQRKVPPKSKICIFSPYQWCYLPSRLLRCELAS